MPYNTDLNRVKDFLENPTGVDEELDRDLDSAFGEVRDTLKSRGFNVPLSDGSESIKEAEALLAAAKFRERRHTDSMKKDAELFRAEALRILKNYMSGNSTELGWSTGESV